MEPLRFESGPYAPALHQDFVKSNWCWGAREPWQALADRLKRPEVTCLVAHVPGDPDSFLGWVAVEAGAVLWTYTRSLYGRIRRRGLMTSLLLLADVDVSQPTPCLYWSPAASEIAARGYRIYYAPRGARRAA